MLKLLLIDEQPDGLREALEYAGYKVDVARDGLEGASKLFHPQSNYDVVILDVEIPRLSGWELLGLIHKTPELNYVQVVILTSQDSEEDVVKGLHWGADLYLGKPISARRLLAHLEALKRRRISREEAHQTVSSTKNADLLLGITRREREILSLLVKGYSNQQIADKLFISETTVKNHLAHIFRKLKVNNRTQAAYLARKLKLD